ncbi:hypothetical protein AB3S75_011949 [Citrus x aurantiifolia]
MEAAKSSPAQTTETTKRNQETSPLSRVRKDCLFFKTSLQEVFCYVKAWFIGQAKKATARNEREATEADQQIWKMQVEAADNAEETKKRLDKSM